MSLNPEQHINRAKARLSSSRLLLDNGFHECSGNRSYYACFEAAKAALMSAGSPEPTSHHGVHVLFHQYIVKTGLVDVSTSKFLNLTEEVRLLADYTAEVKAVDDFIEVITAEEAENAYKDACEFVDHVESRLDSIRELNQASPDEPSKEGDTPTNTDTESPGRK